MLILFVKGFCFIIFGSHVLIFQLSKFDSLLWHQGRFEIISHTGSYVRNEIGTRTGGLSVCLSNTDGQIIGGGVGGPLKAAGPVQVISERTMEELFDGKYELGPILFFFVLINAICALKNCRPNHQRGLRFKLRVIEQDLWLGHYVPLDITKLIKWKGLVIVADMFVRCGHEVANICFKVKLGLERKLYVISSLLMFQLVL